MQDKDTKLPYVQLLRGYIFGKKIGTLKFKNA